jgi:hypothetical protein
MPISAPTTSVATEISMLDSQSLQEATARTR